MNQNLYWVRAWPGDRCDDRPNSHRVATIYATVQFTTSRTRERNCDAIAASTPTSSAGRSIQLDVGDGARESRLPRNSSAGLGGRGLSYRVAPCRTTRTSVQFRCPAVYGDFPSCFLTFEDRDVILLRTTTRSPDLEPASGRYVTQETVATPSARSLSIAAGARRRQARRQEVPLRDHHSRRGYPRPGGAGQEFLPGGEGQRRGDRHGDFNSAADGSNKRRTRADEVYFEDAWDTNPGDPGSVL